MKAFYIHVGDVIMSVAFSDSEMETIRAKLKKRARECMTRYGVRKTSVADLVAAAGISTGAFYKFFDSKELLFFIVMEDMHEEIYASAAESLRKHAARAPRERVALALMVSARKTEELGLMQVWEEEAAYMLRKLPPEALRDHERGEGDRIVRILAEFGIEPCLPPGETAAVVQCLFDALGHRKDLEPERSRRVSEFMIRAICEKLFPDPRDGE
jgi:AcrR family transcriptional regulator